MRSRWRILRSPMLNETPDQDKALIQSSRSLATKYCRVLPEIKINYNIYVLYFQNVFSIGMILSITMQADFFPACFMAFTKSFTFLVFA